MTKMTTNTLCMAVCLLLFIHLLHFKTWIDHVLCRCRHRREYTLYAYTHIHILEYRKKCNQTQQLPQNTTNENRLKNINEGDNDALIYINAQHVCRKLWRRRRRRQRRAYTHTHTLAEGKSKRKKCESEKIKWNKNGNERAKAKETNEWWWRCRWSMGERKARECERTKRANEWQEPNAKRKSARLG